MLVSPNLSHIHGRIAEIGIRQADLAAYIGIHGTLLNAILRGRRPMPEEMETRIHAALNVLEEAKRAGREAEERVLEEALEKALPEEEGGC